MFHPSWLAAGFPKNQQTLRHRIVSGLLCCKFAPRPSWKMLKHVETTSSTSWQHSCKEPREPSSFHSRVLLCSTCLRWFWRPIIWATAQSRRTWPYEFKKVWVHLLQRQCQSVHYQMTNVTGSALQLRYSWCKVCVLFCWMLVVSQPCPTISN